MLFCILYYDELFIQLILHIYVFFMNSYSHIFSKTHTGIDIDQLWIPCSGGSNTGCECVSKNIVFVSTMKYIYIHVTALTYIHYLMNSLCLFTNTCSKMIVL